MKDQEAFIIKQGVCYIPETSDIEYTYQDILEIAMGNKFLAEIIFQLCEWQHPETIFQDLLDEGEIEADGTLLPQL